MAAPRFRTSKCLSSARLHCAWRTLSKEKQASCRAQSDPSGREGLGDFKPWWPAILDRVSRLARLVSEDSMRTWHCWQWFDWKLTCAKSQKTTFMPSLVGFCNLFEHWLCRSPVLSGSAASAPLLHLGAAWVLLAGCWSRGCWSLLVLLLLLDCWLLPLQVTFLQPLWNIQDSRHWRHLHFHCFLVAFLAATVAARAGLLLLASFAFLLVFCLAFGLSKKWLGFNWNSSC